MKINNSLADSSCDDLQAEAEWMYIQLYTKSTISNCDISSKGEWLQNSHSAQDEPDASSILNKLKTVIGLMRGKKLQANCLKEHIQPEFDINKLAKIKKLHKKWSNLKKRKIDLIKLMEPVVDYQMKVLVDLEADQAQVVDDKLGEMVLITKTDFQHILSVQSKAVLNDMVTYYMRHYAHIISAQIKAVDVDGASRKMVQSFANDKYEKCRKAGILGFVERLDLLTVSLKSLKEVFNQQDQSHVQQDSFELTEIAKEYLSKDINTVEKVMRAVKYMVVTHISCEPMLRKKLREMYFNTATISVNLTEKGKK